VGKRKTPTASGDIRKVKPAMTPEARENQLISMAYDLVEQRLLDGTATSQETTHFLKMGSLKARLEAEKLQKENELLLAKTEAIQSSKRIEELYSKAILAMKNYSGSPEEEQDEELF
jgi:hypothetical protein